MSLHPQPRTPVPPQTRQVAQAAFPRGNRYLQLRATLGTLYDDALFADLFPQRGQAAALAVGGGDAAAIRRKSRRPPSGRCRAEPD